MSKAYFEGRDKTKHRVEIALISTGDKFATLSITTNCLEGTLKSSLKPIQFNMDIGDSITVVIEDDA